MSGGHPTPHARAWFGAAASLVHVLKSSGSASLNGRPAAMVDITDIQGMVSSLQSVTEIAKTIVGLHNSSAIKAKVGELQSAVLSAQQSAMSAYSAHSTLVERVRELERQVTEMEAWETEKQRYELHQLPPGTYLYRIKPEMQGSEPMHYICANCYQSRQKSILQGGGLSDGQETFECVRCKSRFTAGIWEPSL